MQHTEAEFRSWLPEGFLTEISQFELQQDGFSCTVRCDILRKSQAAEWVAKFSQNSLSTWIVRRCYPDSKRYQFRQDFVCNRSSFNKVIPKQRKRSTRNMNTDCQSRLSIKIKLNTRDTRKRDRYVKNGLMAVICLNWLHNHDLYSAEALSYHRILPEVKMQFREFFRQGLRPPEAMAACRADLERLPDAELKLANASLNPRPSTVYHLYQAFQEEILGGSRYSLAAWRDLFKNKRSENTCTAEDEVDDSAEDCHENSTYPLGDDDYISTGTSWTNDCCHHSNDGDSTITAAVAASSTRDDIINHSPINSSMEICEQQSTVDQEEPSCSITWPSREENCSPIHSLQQLEDDLNVEKIRAKASDLGQKLCLLLNEKVELCAREEPELICSGLDCFLSQLHQVNSATDFAAFLLGDTGKREKNDLPSLQKLSRKIVDNDDHA